VRLYGNLSRTIALFGRVRVLDFDDFAAGMFVRLLQENPTLSKQRLQKDMRIDLNLPHRSNFEQSKISKPINWKLRIKDLRCRIGAFLG